MPRKLNLTERKILNILEAQHEATTKETAAQLDISEATVRRIFERLANLSLVERVHGGAYLQTSNAQIRNYRDKDKRNQAEKIAIAHKTAALIKRRDLIFLNSGSTTTHLFKYITSEKVHIVTNNIQLASQSYPSNITLSFLAGIYDPNTRSVGGSAALESLDPIFSSLTILGTNGIHPSHGLTSNSLSEVGVSKKMIKNTIGKVIILADHEKINRVANHRVCDIDMIDILITDDKAPQEFITSYEEKGVEVVITPTTPSEIKKV